MKTVVNGLFGPPYL